MRLIYLTPQEILDEHKKLLTDDCSNFQLLDSVASMEANVILFSYSFNTDHGIHAIYTVRIQRAKSYDYHNFWDNSHDAHNMLTALRFALIGELN